MPGEAQITCSPDPYGEYVGDIIKYIEEWKNEFSR